MSISRGHGTCICHHGFASASSTCRIGRSNSDLGEPRSASVGIAAALHQHHNNSADHHATKPLLCGSCFARPLSCPVLVAPDFAVPASACGTRGHAPRLSSARLPASHFHRLLPHGACRCMCVAADRYARGRGAWKAGNPRGRRVCDWRGRDRHGHWAGIDRERETVSRAEDWRIGGSLQARACCVRRVNSFTVNCFALTVPHEELPRCASVSRQFGSMIDGGLSIFIYYIICAPWSV